ncbi:pyruvate dehydrogenase E2 component (dihydrolipoamide acetyltransferase) [Roseovarius pacificus]|jgi:pyruvate dehydrogenase E2 component (dihydrolipoamide acetyltransferase)|uniref:Dihydrolipoamide acetyltransferase component of pyruvate dehydrogenase complex n=1 Tax=Roseovarius pacificus TaxID=337701 RepID=A0A1M7KLQ6_9RHOB|nr:2-oxo acid dehydrogenase subunit E2 [Roseovarius pacificus]GGO63050.1 acetyltransferase component of pyruvate dehydrogenase complex [Roseovarius pacificus]SHM66325.1 pyruvate dehydrogenase E2 component (dihydrolipoamide acetyltransferase) [Roseovarius pacificus]
MTNKIELRVPDIGDFKDVEIIEIPIGPGDTIKTDDTVIVLESDKATLDVPSDQAGKIVELKVAVGDTVSQGSVIALIESAEQAAPAEPAPAPEKPAPEPEIATPEAPKASPFPAAEPSALPAATPTDRLAHASPAIRKMARELGVTIGEVPGTGPHGRITRDDLTRFVKRVMSGTGAAPAAGPGFGGDLPPWPEVDFEAFGPVERVPLSRICKISGPSLARNAIVIPHVTNFEEADVTETEVFRKTANAEGPEAVKLTMLAFVVKACVSALKAYPEFNSSLDGDHVVVKKYYHIGVAADTPGGLVVPVIREADAKSLREIAGEMKDLAGKARTGKLGPKDMQGATFTISSLGGIGGTNFTPIINAPEVAILGMTRAAIQPKWDGAAFQPRLIQPMSLSWDHRVVDGVAAAKFLVHVRDVLSDFRRISL